MSARAKPLSDTTPSMAQVHIRLLREAGPVRRAALAAAMTTNAVAVSRRAIRHLHPNWSELEVNLHWAEIHYGKELTRRVRAYIARRKLT